MITPNECLFFQTKPYITLDRDNEDPLGLILHEKPQKPSYMQPHFTLDKNKMLDDNYKTLKIKMEGLYLYSNDNFNTENVTSLRSDTTFVHNEYSFSSKYNQEAKYDYCQALFYATSNEPELNLTSVDINKDYLGNGIFYSNLTTANWTTALVVDNQQDYQINNEYVIYNDSYIKEYQSLDNPKVWNNMAISYVHDNKMYTNSNTSNDNQFYHFKCFIKLNNKNVNFTGYVTRTTLTGLLSLTTGYSTYYLEKDYDNWSPDCPDDKFGVFAYKETNENTFRNYRKDFYGTTAQVNGGHLGDKNISDEVSSNWLLYSNDFIKDESNYYSQYGNIITFQSHLGIMPPGIQYDLIWKKTNYDIFGNLTPELSPDQTFKEYGMSPPFGLANQTFTFSKITLNKTINLDEMSGDYIHIFYPCVTNIQPASTGENSELRGGIIPQMTMTYEAFK